MLIQRYRIRNIIFLFSFNLFIRERHLPLFVCKSHISGCERSRPWLLKLGLPVIRRLAFLLLIQLIVLLLVSWMKSLFILSQRWKHQMFLLLFVNFLFCKMCLFMVNCEVNRPILVECLRQDRAVKSKILLLPVITAVLQLILIMIHAFESFKIRSTILLTRMEPVLCICTLCSCWRLCVISTMLLLLLVLLFHAICYLLLPLRVVLRQPLFHMYWLVRRPCLFLNRILLSVSSGVDFL